MERGRGSTVVGPRNTIMGWWKPALSECSPLLLPAGLLCICNTLASPRDMWGKQADVRTTHISFASSGDSWCLQPKQPCECAPHLYSVSDLLWSLSSSGSSPYSLNTQRPTTWPRLCTSTDTSTLLPYTGSSTCGRQQRGAVGECCRQIQLCARTCVDSLLSRVPQQYSSSVQRNQDSTAVSNLLHPCSPSPARGAPCCPARRRCCCSRCWRSCCVLRRCCCRRSAAAPAAAAAANAARSASAAIASCCCCGCAG